MVHRKNGVRETTGGVTTVLLRVPVLLYRYLLSPLLPRACRYTPSCSVYTLEALRTHGAWRGLWLSARRLGRCHPWCNHPHDDPVPKRCLREASKL